jgi:hypothetical protein
VRKPRKGLRMVYVGLRRFVQFTHRATC